MQLDWLNAPRVEQIMNDDVHFLYGGLFPHFMGIVVLLLKRNQFGMNGTQNILLCVIKTYGSITYSLPIFPKQQKCAITLCQWTYIPVSFMHLRSLSVEKITAI